MIDMIQPTKHTIHRYQQRTPMANARLPNRSIHRVSPTILSDHNTRFHRRIRDSWVSIQNLAIVPGLPHVQSRSYRPPRVHPSTASHPWVSWGEKQGIGAGAVHGSPNRRFDRIHEPKDRDAKRRIGRNRASIRYRVIWCCARTTYA